MMCCNYIPFYVLASLFIPLSYISPLFVFVYTVNNVFPLLIIPFCYFSQPCISVSYVYLSPIIHFILKLLPPFYLSSAVRLPSSFLTPLFLFYSSIVPFASNNRRICFLYIIKLNPRYCCKPKVMN